MPEIKPWQVLVGLGVAGIAGYLLLRFVRPVVAPPALHATSITVSPETVPLGELTTLTTTVQNPRREPLSGTLVFTVDGIEIQRVETDAIAGGEVREFVITYMPGEAGTFNVCAKVI